MQHFITKRFGEYPFAHRQPTHAGHCAQVHGHGWVFDVSFTSDRTDESGFIVDFGKMDALKARFTEMFDHTLLISKSDPKLGVFLALHQEGLASVVQVDDGSCEGLARLVFFETVRWIVACPDLVERGVKVVSVTCHEDSKNSATHAAIPGHSFYR